MSQTALYRVLKTPAELEKEGPFTADQWYSIAARPERDPELASCLIRFSKRRLYVDVERLDVVLEQRRVAVADGRREVGQ